jgi:hypothetical protein
VGAEVSTAPAAGCVAAARTGVGAVPRAQLEGWLQSHCRPLLAAVDAATMLDMLLRHTYGELHHQRDPCLVTSNPLLYL